MATVVFFHAHPDDEAIATGGTMAALSGAGHRVVLVTATAGELGERPEGLLAPGQSLAERRRAELAEACSVLGVARHLFLGYRDSGMAGEPTNDDPDCFWQADVEEAAGRLAAVLAEERADAVTFYDEHGGYGHPDHVQVHRVGRRAAELAATPRAYMATINRDHVRRLMAEAVARGGFPDGVEPPADTDGLGEPEARITTAVDVVAQLPAKRRAMAAHASQIAETSFFLAMGDEDFARMWGTEWYIRLGADAGAVPPGTGLLDETVSPPAGR